MPMLPFEPELPEEREEATPAAPKKPASGDPAWSVSRLGKAIKETLTAGLPGKVRVVGEISNLSDRNHWFFSLKDEGAAIRCVMFASSARRVSFPVNDGQEVIATGRVDFYDAQGSVQLYVDKMEPVGQGARELQLQQLVAELRELGYFDLEHKRALPVLPRRVAVVTSRSAAALQDVIDTAARRWAGCELLLFDVRVQGEEAAPQVAKALRALSVDGPGLGIDAIILTRGGGSIEDLWAFNERAVADAVFECGLPIVAAIGHETDTTLAELVADVRCATPTQAAMTLIPDAQVLQQQVAQLDRRLGLSLTRLVDQSRRQLDAMARHPVLRRPDRLIAAAEHTLDQATQRLHSALPRRTAPARSRLNELHRRLSDAPARRLELAARKLDALTRTLEAVSPEHVLHRGYTYTLSPDGKPLRSAADAVDAKQLTTVFNDGRVESTVGSSDTPPPPPALPTPAPRKPRKLKPYKLPGSDPDQPTLFA